MHWNKLYWLWVLTTQPTFPTWTAAIDVSAVEAAEAIMHHLNNQKMIMMGLDSGIYCRMHGVSHIVKNAFAYKCMQTCMYIC